MKSLLDRFQKLFRLPARERLILAHAWGLFLVAEIALRVLPFQRVLRFEQRLADTAGERTAVASPSDVARLGWLVEVASRHVPIRATCLKKALVLSWLLGRQGVVTTLRIGVAHTDGEFTAHAWLEYAGQPVLADEIEGYEPLRSAR